MNAGASVFQLSRFQPARMSALCSSVPSRLIDNAEDKEIATVDRYYLELMRGEKDYLKDNTAPGQSDGLYTSTMPKISSPGLARSTAPRDRKDFVAHRIQPNER